jgi:hypothetical protein
MSETIEFYDPNFCPELRRFATGDHVQYLDAHHVPNKGYPAPTLNGSKAAYWLSKPNDPEQVVPILVVSVPRGMWNVDPSSDWMLGAATSADIINRAEEIERFEESVDPIGAAVLEFAVSGPFVVYEAFVLVARLCPMPEHG